MTLQRHILIWLLNGQNEMAICISIWWMTNPQRAYGGSAMSADTAVAYIWRKIYEEQGADYFPEPIELVDEDIYSRLIAGYEKCMKK